MEGALWNIGAPTTLHENHCQAPPRRAISDPVASVKEKLSKADSPRQGPNGQMVAPNGDPLIRVKLSDGPVAGQRQYALVDPQTNEFYVQNNAGGFAHPTTYNGPLSLPPQARFEGSKFTHPLRAWAHVALVTEPVSLSAGAEVTARKGVVQSLSAQSMLEVPRAKVSAEVQLLRHAADAPLALDEATLAASISPSAGTSLGVQAKLVPAGLDELAAQLATQGDAGSLTVTAAGTKLTTTPTVGLTVTATEKKSGVAVSANAQVTPSTGAAEGGVSVSVPLPEPGRK